MADKVKTPTKKAPVKAKKPTVHPTYSEMVKTALGSLKERGGSSRQALLKYIMANFKVGTDSKAVNVHLKIALRNGVKKETIKQSKGTGAAGSFKLGEQPKPKKEKITKAKKPTAKKVTKPKAAKPAKPAGTKKAAKKATTGDKKTVTKPKKTTKKAVAKKTPKKTTKTTKSPKKTKSTTTKPKKVKTPKKK